MKRAGASTIEKAANEPFGKERRLGSRPKHSAWLVVIAVGMFVCVIAIVIWQLAQPPAISTVRLRDGSRMVLGGLLYGVHQSFDTRSPLERLLQSLQPEESRFGAWNEKSINGATTMWLHNRPLANGVTTAANQRWSFIDEDGCPIHGGDFLLPSHGALDTDLWIPAVPPEAFRNGRGYGVRGYYGDTKEKAFEFYAPSAKGYTRPKPVEWTAHPLPQTVDSGQVSATLGSVTGPRDVFDPCYRAEIQASEQNGRHSRWDVISLSTHDRYGGEMPSLDRFERLYYNTGKGFAFYGLCRREPLWKLSALLVPHAEGTVKPHCLWEVELSLPDARGGLVYAKRQFSAGGVSIELGGPSRYLADAYKVNDGRLHARYSLKVLDADWCGGIAIQAQRSPMIPTWLKRPGLTTGTDSITHITKADRGASIDIPYRTGERSIKVQLAGYPARQVDFYVKPPNNPQTTRASSPGGTSFE